MKRGQKGFGAVEALLILVIVGTLAAVGWYVYDTKKDADATYNKAENAAYKNDGPSSTSQSQEAAGYLEIKEWGVKIALTAPIKNATYLITAISKDIPGPYAFLSTKEINEHPSCKDDLKPDPEYYYPTFQYIERFNVKDKVWFQEDLQVPATEAVKRSPKTYQQVGDSVFHFGHGNGNWCEGQPNNTLTAFEKAFLTISTSD